MQLSCLRTCINCYNLAWEFGYPIPCGNPDVSAVRIGNVGKEIRTQTSQIDIDGEVRQVGINLRVVYRNLFTVTPSQIKPASIIISPPVVNLLKIRSAASDVQGWRCH